MDALRAGEGGDILKAIPRLIVAKTAEKYPWRRPKAMAEA